MRRTCVLTIYYSVEIFRIVDVGRLQCGLPLLESQSPISEIIVDSVAVCHFIVLTLGRIKKKAAKGVCGFRVPWPSVGRV
jgi:hypothetical protein